MRGEWAEERTYSNDYFGMTVSIPSGWDVLKGDEANMDFLRKSIGLASGGNRVDEDTLQQRLSKIHVPMRTFAEPATQTTRNPSVLVMIEDIQDDPSIKTGADVLTKMENFMGAGPQLPKFTGPPTETTLQGTNFWTRSSTLDVNGGESMLFSGAGGYTIRQQGYSTVKGHYALTILRTWFSSSNDPTAEISSKHIMAMKKPAAAVEPAPNAAAKPEGKGEAQDRGHE